MMSEPMLTLWLILYGLPFFILWTVIAILTQKESKFTIAKTLWLIAGFGLAHGIHEWTEFFEFQFNLKLDAIDAVSLAISFYFLIQFGISTLVISARRNRLLHLIPIAPVLIWFLLVARFPHQFMTTEIGDVYGRYSLGFLGCFLTAFVFFEQRNQFRKTGRPDIVRSVYLTSGGFFFYGLVSGLIVPDVRALPGSLIDYTTFYHATGVPVQALRAVAITFIAYTMTRFLRIFEWEKVNSIINAKEELTREVEEHTAELTKANQKLKLLIETEPECVKLLSRDGSVIQMNRAGLNLLDAQSEDQVLNKSLYAIVDRQYRRAFEDLTERVFRGESDSLEFEIVGLKGRRLWLETHAAPLRNEKNKIIALLGITRDITARKQAEASLKQRERQLAESQQIAHIGSWERNVATGDMFWSEEMFRIFDLDPKTDNVDFNRFMSTIHPDDRSAVRRAIEETIRFDKPYSTDFRIILKNGSIRFLHAQAEIRRDQAGNPVLRGTAQDITERKLAEVKVQQSEIKYRSLFESSMDGIFILGLDGAFLDVNRIAYMRLGYTKEELLALNIRELDPPEFARRVPERFKLIREQGFGVFESAHRRKDGSVMPVEINSRVIQYGERQAYLSIIRDITERKREEERLRKSRALSEALNAINETIHSTLDFNDMTRAVTVLAASAIDADSAVLYMRENDVWAARYVYGLPQSIVDQCLTDEEIRYSIIASEEKRAIVINDVFQDELLKNCRLVTEFKIAALMDIALIVDGNFIGNLAIHYHTPEKKFTDLEVDFINKTASSFMLAFKNARLFERLSTVLDSIAEAYYALDRNWKVIELNKEAEKILGPASEVLGRMYWDKFKGTVGTEIDRQYHVAMQEGHSVHFEALSRINGKWYEFHAYPRENRLEVYFSDINERKNMEEEIRHTAQHDALTGLPNRTLFADILKVEAAQARRNRSKMALLFLDLDRFKEINDTLGHAAGDQLLKEVSLRITKSIREADAVARIGGDEFNVLLADISNVEDVSDIVRKITTSFQAPFLISEQELHITTSIGISIFPDDSMSIDTLLRYADIAMYYAKERGRNNFQFYNSEINTRSVEKIRLEGMLRQTIVRGEMVVYYQPQVSIEDRRIVSAEALARWNHPEQGILEPYRFIPAAEDSGFIAAIDEFVLQTACEQMRSWSEAGLPRICVTVNLSAQEFQNPDLTRKVSAILTANGVPPDCLVIEITESLAMSNIEHTIKRLNELVEMGVHIAIDDFGTGYSSLNHLKRLPVDKLKIDKSFIHDMTTDPDDRTIINAVTAMAHTMKLKVIAEGVETEDQFESLKGLKCDEAQGYLFSNPLPEEQFKELIRANR